MTDNTFPVSDGDVLYASTINSFSHARSIAQLAYEQVKSDASNWTNSDYLGADIFTDSNGAKNTVDTTNSTAEYYSTGKYYKLVENDTLQNPDSWTNPENAFDSDSTTSTSIQSSSTSLGRTFSSARTISNVLMNVRMYGNDSSATKLAKLQSYDGSSWNDEVTIIDETGSGYSTYNSTYSLSKSVQGLRILFSSNESLTTNEIFQLQYDDLYISPKTIETNTIINDVVPDSIIVYGKYDTPTNTNITIDVSDDGGTTWSLTGKSFNTPIDTSSFSTGNLALKFNLSTTDTSVTPKLYGYGLNISQ